MSNYEHLRESQEGAREEVFSKSVRAGRRTYFFDVKATRDDDYYLIITESRKIQEKDGRSVYDKHKIYLYKEDFVKFGDCLDDVLKFLKTTKPDFFNNPHNEDDKLSIDEEFDRL